MSDSNNVVAWLILGYFCSHPQAKDTITGIGRWWLPTEGVEAERETVARALVYLEQLGWVTTVESPSGQRIYGLNQTRQSLLRQFLHSQPDGSVHQRQAAPSIEPDTIA